MKQIFKLLLFPISLFVLLSCGSSKELKNAINNQDPEEGPRERLELAHQYYEEGDYYKAIQLYEIVINENIMVNDLEEVYFRYAGAHYAQYDYLTASTLYNSFYRAYPDSENADPAYFYRAKSTYQMAESDPRLDQTTMIDALQELQDYLITFPEGIHATEATAMIEEIKIINQQKELGVGQLYHKTENYKAAIVEFNRFIEDYPTSELVEQAYFEMLRSRFELAEHSVDSKRKERYELVLEHYGYFMEKYSTGPYAKQAKEIQSETEEQLKQLT